MSKNPSAYEIKFRNQTLEQKHHVTTWLDQCNIEMVRHPFTDEYCITIDLKVRHGVAAKERKKQFIKWINKKLREEKHGA